jgi:hypothetical protein
VSTNPLALPEQFGPNGERIEIGYYGEGCEFPLRVYIPPDRLAALFGALGTVELVARGRRRVYSFWRDEQGREMGRWHFDEYPKEPTAMERAAGLPFIDFTPWPKP